jgi:hypothetical protein
MHLEIESPCSVPWERMAGNDRVRYCLTCDLNVYNLMDLEPAQIEAVVRKSGGRLCGRIYVRGDDTFTLRRCRGGRARRGLALLLGLGALLVMAGASWMLRTQVRVDRTQFPSLVRQVLQWIDPEPVRKMMMGKIIQRPPPGPPRPALPGPRD